MDGTHVPLLWLSITPRTPADRLKLARGLAWLMSEDAALGVQTETEGGVTISAAGEQHLDIILDRLAKEFGVEAAVGRPRVADKETVRRAAEGEMKLHRRVGGRSEYAHVKVRVHPGAPGSGYVFENAILSGTIPDAFVDPVDEGIRTALLRGVLAGYPVDDVRVVFYDGSYHDIDSSGAAFTAAASMAFQDAARKGSPTLLQPVMRVEVVGPDDHAAGIADGLKMRGGRIYSTEDRDGTQVITARAPLSGLFGYGADLRERTKGRATFTMRLDGYEPFEAPGDGGRDSFVGAPRKPPPTRNASSIALPEPVDDEDDDEDDDD